MRSTQHPTAKDAAAQGFIQRLLSWLCSTVLMFPGVALGMDFKVYYQPQLKLKMLIGRGGFRNVMQRSSSRSPKWLTVMTKVSLPLF
jgi:hypothetical protein